MNQPAACNECCTLGTEKRIDGVQWVWNVFVRLYQKKPKNVPLQLELTIKKNAEKKRSCAASPIPYNLSKPEKCISYCTAPILAPLWSSKFWSCDTLKCNTKVHFIINFQSRFQEYLVLNNSVNNSELTERFSLWQTLVRTDVALLGMNICLS